MARSKRMYDTQKCITFFNFFSLTFQRQFSQRQRSFIEHALASWTCQSELEFLDYIRVQSVNFIWKHNQCMLNQNVQLTYCNIPTEDPFEESTTATDSLNKNRCTNERCSRFILKLPAVESISLETVVHTLVTLGISKKHWNATCDI